VNVQLPGIPRTPEGKPNLSAPAPRTADGKPDLSGIWMQVPLYGRDGYSDYVASPQLNEEQYQKLIAKPDTPTANLNQNLQFRTTNGEEIPFRSSALALYKERLQRDSTGSPSERFRRVDFGHMELELTIDDPKAYTKPWTVKIPFEFVPGVELMDDACENPWTSDENPTEIAPDNRTRK